jgi:hypothetical protein
MAERRSRFHPRAMRTDGPHQRHPVLQHPTPRLAVNPPMTVPAFAGQEGFGFWALTMAMVAIAGVVVAILRRIGWV